MKISSLYFIVISLIASLFILTSCGTGLFPGENNGGTNGTEDTPAPDELAAQSFNNAWAGFVKLSELFNIDSNTALPEFSEKYGLTLSGKDGATSYVYDNDLTYSFGSSGGSEFLSILRQYDDGSVTVSTLDGNTSVSLAHSVITEEALDKVSLWGCNTIPEMSAQDLSASEEAGVYTISTEYVKKMLAALDGADMLYDLLCISDQDIDLLSFCIKMTSFESKGEIGIRISDKQSAKSYLYTTVKLGIAGVIERITVSTFVESGKFTANLAFDSERVATGNFKYEEPGSNRVTGVEFKIPEIEIERDESLGYAECLDTVFDVKISEEDTEIITLKLTGAKKPNGISSGKCTLKLTKEMFELYIGSYFEEISSILPEFSDDICIDLCFDITADEGGNVSFAAVDGEMSMGESKISVSLKIDFEAFTTACERPLEILFETNGGIGLALVLETAKYSDGVFTYNGTLDLTSPDNEEHYSLSLTNENLEIPELSEKEQLYLDRAAKYFDNLDYHKSKIEDINEYGKTYIVSNYDPDMYIAYDSRYGLAYVTVFSGSYLYTSCVIDYENYEYIAAKHGGRFRDYTNSPFLAEVQKYIEAERTWKAPEGFEEQIGYGSGDYYIAFRLEGYNGYAMVHPYSYPKSAVITAENPDGLMYNGKLVHLLHFNEDGNVVLHHFTATTENADGTVSKECTCGKIINSTKIY